MADEDSKPPIIPGSNGKIPKPKFNFYWIYILLIGVFLAMTFINWNGTVKTIYEGQLRKLISEQYVEKIQAVNKENARIFIKKDKLSLPEFKDVQNSKSYGGESPQYTYQFGTTDSFQSLVKEEQIKKDAQGHPIIVDGKP